MNSLKDIFKKADINVSLLRINIGVKNETPTVNDETILRQMLDVIKKSGKKLLITIDEVAFLYRAPKIILKPLDYQLMTDAYKKVLSIPLSSASKMARLTMGYSFAFQMFGYLYWDNNCEKEIEEILSDTDKKIICELAKQGTSKVKDIRKALDMSSQKF